MRERSPGVWEILVAVGVDPVSGRTLQRSLSFHGSADDAEPRHMETRPCGPSGAPAAAFLTVGELLNRWLVAYHDWRPTPGSRLVPTSRPLMAAASRDAGSRPSSPNMSGRLWRRRAPGKAVAPHQAGGIDF